jgi:hypothetical protein
MPYVKQHKTALNGHTTHHSLEEVRSEAVQEIMGKMPPWIIRSGIYLVALLTAGLLAGAWFFHYPEIVKVQVTIRQQQQHYVAAGNIPVAAAWKVKAGQPVLIKLTAYPQEEFGMLQGTVTSISATKFYVDIQLTHGLVTTAGKTLPPHPLLDGTAEITTEDKSIAARLFGKLWKME